MFAKHSLAIVFLLVSTIAPQLCLHAEDPSGDRKTTAGKADPFARPDRRPDRFQWRQFLSIKQSLVSGCDVVSSISPTSVTLGSGNVFNTDMDTAIVRQSPGQPPSPANRNDISVGTPISYEINIERGTAASRIVVWHGFGPDDHKIYSDRIAALIRPLQNRGMNPQMIELDYPEQSMLITYASSKRLIAPGEPQLVHFEEPQRTIDVVCGEQKQTVSVGKKSSAVVAFRSYGSRGMILFIE